MASYFPLIVNSGSGTIDELPLGDDLNLAGSNIANANTITASNITAAGGVANLSNSSSVDLGAVGNLHISGGSSGQFLSTNGSGTLSWAAGGSQSNIANGTSNVAIAVSGGNVTTSVGGNSNILTVTGTGANVAGTFNATGNSTLGNLSVSGVVSSNLIPAGNGVQSLGNATNQWSNLYLTGNTIYLGNATISANATTIVMTNPAGGQTVFGGNTGNSDISGQTLSITGNANVGNIGGTRGVFTTVTGSLITAAQPNITSVGTLTSVSVSGNANVGNIGGTVGSFATVAGALITAAQPNITSTGTLASLSVTANANIGNIGTGGLITATGNLNAGNIITGGIVSATGNINAGNVITGGSISATGNGTFGNVTATTFNGAFSGAATTAGTVTTNAQPNITSLGTLTGLNINGNLSVNGATVSGNIVPTSNNTYSLGSLTSYWKDAFIGPGSLYINGVKVLEESSNSIVISADLNQTVRVTSSGSGDVQLQTTGSGIIAVKGPLQIQAGNYITSSNGGPIGFSNPINVDSISSLTANTNLTISANGTGNIQINDDVTITGNLSINGGGGNLSVTSLSVEDNIIDVSAETTGTPVNNAGIRVIRGDDPSVQNRWNETTDTWQITNDGSTYLNVVGANTTTGNANVGNIGATGGIFTTVAGALTTAAQPNITSTGTLASISVTGNANTGNVGTTNLVATGTGSFGANVNMNSQWVNNVGYPSSNNDAATKQYVDTMISSGISYHEPVYVATTTTLQIATSGTTSYNSPNGAANGIGAYISTTGTFLNIDGANVQTVGTRILVKNESNAAWNGIYTYSNSTAITRSTDADEYGPDSTTQLSINDYFFTTSGTVNEGTSFIVSAPTGTITFGTSNIVFSTFSTSQVYDAGTGLTLTGTTFSVNASQTQITAVGTLTSLSASGNANVGNIGATNGVFTNVSGNGSALTSITGGNVTGQVTYAATANAVAGGNVSGQVTYAATANAVAGANVSGAVTYATTANSVAGANVTGAVTYATTANSVAGANVSGSVNLANYASTANAVALANVAGIGNIASLNINGNASTILYGNGVFAAAPVTYGNANVATFLASYGSNTITTTGNVSVGNIIGNGQALTGLAGANVTGTVPSATTAGTVTTAAQGNITSVGTLTSASVSGNANVGNLGTGGLITATGNLNAGNIITGGIVSATGNGTFGNVTATTFTGSFSGAATSATTAGTVTTAAQGNITSVGTLTSVSVSGNANVGNLFSTAAVQGTTLTSNIATGSAPLVVTSTTRVANLNVAYANVSDYSAVQTATTGNYYLNFVSALTGNVQEYANATFVANAANGAITATTFVGSLSGAATSATSATTAGTVTTAAQPNITSVGTLTSVSVSGTSNLGAVGNVTITGGTNGQVLTTNGSNVLSWTTVSGGGGGASISNGTSNVNIASSGGNVTVGVGGSAGILTISTSGANILGTMTATTVTETSSLALKENFRPIENPLEKVLQLLGQIYDRKDGSSKNEAGLVAEDVYKVIPNLVKTDANGNPESVFYSRLSVYLLESIKVLSDEITKLKSEK